MKEMEKKGKKTYKCTDMFFNLLIITMTFAYILKVKLWYTFLIIY